MSGIQLDNAMCTVTLYCHSETEFVLTSNRDESPNRTSVPPDFYEEDGVRLLYPKDQVAGGTWIGVADQNRAVCLINGAFGPYDIHHDYPKSRGNVVKAMLIADDVELTMRTMDLSGVAPFTLVVVDWSKALTIYQWIWDGQATYLKVLPKGVYIWSSAMLYDAQMRSERHTWFETFKATYALSARSLLAFHTSKTTPKTHGIVMDRGVVKTTSITQITKTDHNLVMYYKDLLNHDTCQVVF